MGEQPTPTDQVSAMEQAPDQVSSIEAICSAQKRPSTKQKKRPTYWVDSGTDTGSDDDDTDGHTHQMKVEPKTEVKVKPPPADPPSSSDDEEMEVWVKPKQQCAVSNGGVQQQQGQQCAVSIGNPQPQQRCAVSVSFGDIQRQQQQPAVKNNKDPFEKSIHTEIIRRCMTDLVVFNQSEPQLRDVPPIARFDRPWQQHANNLQRQQLVALSNDAKNLQPQQLALSNEYLQRQQLFGQQQWAVTQMELLSHTPSRLSKALYNFRLHATPLCSPSLPESMITLQTDYWRPSLPMIFLINYSQPSYASPPPTASPESAASTEIVILDFIYALFSEHGKIMKKENGVIRTLHQAEARMHIRKLMPRRPVTKSPWTNGNSMNRTNAVFPSPALARNATNARNGTDTVSNALATTFVVNGMNANSVSPAFGMPPPTSRPPPTSAISRPADIPTSAIARSDKPRSTAKPTGSPTTAGPSNAANASYWEPTAANPSAWQRSTTGRKSQNRTDPDYVVTKHNERMNPVSNDVERSAQHLLSLRTEQS